MATLIALFRRSRPVKGLAAALLGAGIFPASATTILSHIGSTNPTSEGWTVLTSGSGSPTSQLSPINDGGTQAWYIYNFTNNQQSRYYQGAINPAVMAGAKMSGYEISFQVKGVFTNANADTQTISLSDGTDFWQVQITGESSGTATRIFGSWSGFIAVNHYDTVTLRFNSGGTAMDVFVNGVEQAVDLTSTPFVTATPRLEWGFSNPPNAVPNEVRYASVKLDSIPEPSIMILSVVAAVFGLSRRKRQL